MIVTNLGNVPGKTIEKTMGLAFGFSSARKGKGKDLVIHRSGQEMKWSDKPEHFELLFRSAEERLVASARDLGGDAVIKVEGRLSRSDDGIPEMMLIGTAVATVEGDEDEAGVSIKYDGEESTWESPAATPDIDLLKRSKGRGERIGKRMDDDEGLIIGIGDEIGLPRDRMELLFHAGFRKLEDLSDASIKEITSVDGINPTQARLIKRISKEKLEE